jgi:hypothetical protein
MKRKPKSDHRNFVPRCYRAENECRGETGGTGRPVTTVYLDDSFTRPSSIPLKGSRNTETSPAGKTGSGSAQAVLISLERLRLPVRGHWDLPIRFQSISIPAGQKGWLRTPLGSNATLTTSSSRPCKLSSPRTSRFFSRPQEF